MNVTQTAEEAHLRVRLFDVHDRHAAGSPRNRPSVARATRPAVLLDSTAAVLTVLAMLNPFATMPTALLAGYAFILGASVASFLAVVAERIPQRRSIGGRSRCVCGRQLTGADLVPIVSWVAQRGKARCCGSRIPTSLVIGEIACGATAAFAVVAGGFAWVAVAGAVVYVVAAAQPR